MEIDSKDMSSNFMCMNIRYFVWIIELVELKHNACGHNISPVQHIFFLFLTKQSLHSKTNQWKMQHAFVCELYE